MQHLQVAGASSSFVVNKVWATLIAGGVIVLLSVLAHVLVASTASGTAGSDPVAFRRRGIKALVIGADGRASTSKLQPVLWMFALVFAFMFLFVWGRSTNCGDKNVRKDAGCTEAKAARSAFDNAVNSPLQSQYFVLLGFPLTAAVAAKALTTNKVANGDLTKPPIAGSAPPVGGDAAAAAAGAPAPVGVTQGLSEIISDDHGETDLLDFQYFAFNLLALVYFGIQFITKPIAGIPTLPATLVALSGLSVAAYTTKKALATDVLAAIKRVIPDPIGATTTTVQVLGTGFGPAATATAAASAATVRQVLLDGQPLAVTSWSDNAVAVTMTPGASAAITRHTSAAIVVIDSVGVATDPYAVQIS